MRAALPADPPARPARPVRRNAAVVVADPCIAVVESGERVDPSALDDALGLLVTWAIRACSDSRAEQRTTEVVVGRPSAVVVAPTPRGVAAYGAED